MQTYETKTVREIALDMPVTTRVFEEFKIDYCCHGDRPFNEACASAGTEPGLVIEKIETMLASAAKSEPAGFSNWKLRDLADHIVAIHHTFTRDEMEQLTPLMAKVARKHGEHHEYLVRMELVFQKLCEELWPHLQKEETVLFPYIEQLEHSSEKGTQIAFPPFGTVGNPIRMMMKEHENAGELLAELRELSRDYTLPEGACPSFTALYHRLKAFEIDLHQHIHLENNLLFPRALKLEESMLSSAAA